MRERKRGERQRPRDGTSLPESGIGGASDLGAGGGHPASRARVRDPLPEHAAGDTAIERRHGPPDPAYAGPERRLARQG